jgi:hypothetical protein
MVDGQMYWLTMYDNVSKGGKPYRKLTFKPMENEKPGADRTREKDDVPW